MKKLSIISLFAMLFTSMAFGQNMVQTIRGTILDSDSKSPIYGAQILVVGSDPLIGTVTDFDGVFRLENVPLGKISLQLSYLGYEGQTIPNIEVMTGKEVVLDLYMQESVVQMNEVVVTATENKGDALNEMSLIGSRSISLEQSKRYAGGFNDPSKILSSFAGVTNSQDGNNDIIVRGNSPKYVQWRLEGVEITSPNHFADQNAVSGGISALNNNLLSTSDFHTGAFSAEYGDVLSGVYDVNLRTGNNEKRESSFGIGILGTDVMLEGPFKKGYGGSYLLNYRYSTITLLDKIGFLQVGGIPKFQDAAFKILLPTNKAGIFSFFGLGGSSSAFFKDIQPEIKDTPGDNSMLDNVQEDYDKSAYLMNVGLNHTINLNEKSYIKSSISVAGNGAGDKVYDVNTIPIMGSDGEIEQDSILSSKLNFQSDLKKTTYRAAMTYNNKINAKNKLQAGVKYALFDYDYEQSHLKGDTDERMSLVDFKEQIGTIQSFASWKYRINDDITLVSGVHNMNVLYNKKSTIEPRIAMNWKLNNISSVHAGYGLHSTMESVHNYFAQVETADGNIVTPNKDLGLLKAHHFVAGYKMQFTKNLMAQVELYYQHLYNLPVENLDTSYYATINEGLEFRYVDLVNKGTGENYGVEFTLERSLHRNFYCILNGSVYNSTYKGLDGKERNTAFNGEFLVNFLVGKEFINLGPQKNKSLSLNAKVFYGGGRKYIPLLRDADGNLAVDTEKGRFWDYNKAYDNSLDDLFQFTLSASYKINKQRVTHEFYLNIDNATNSRGRLTEYYDEREPGKVGYVKQFGMFPNLIYRIYF